MPTPIKALNEHTWTTFVRPSVKFKPTPDTRLLIQKVMPYFPKSCHCIAAYLDDEDQFWKVNYHWELLTRMLDKAKGQKLTPAQAAQVDAIRQKLMQSPPVPKTGYFASKVVGLPKDASSHALIKRRWEILKAAKVEFKAIVDAANLTVASPPAQAWHLSVAPVAAPGTSKHGSGYALDIEGHGQNFKIKEISRALGATLTFDEKSHVHVEFRHGVRMPA